MIPSIIDCAPVTRSRRSMSASEACAGVDTGVDALSAACAKTGAKGMARRRARAMRRMAISGRIAASSQSAFGAATAAR
jgi:hypothetical protein